MCDKYHFSHVCNLYFCLILTAFYEKYKKIYFNIAFNLMLQIVEAVVQIIYVADSYIVKDAYELT